MGSPPSGTVETTLNYWLEPEAGGVRETTIGTVGERRRKYAPAQVQIKDIRGHEDGFSLDKHGFQVVRKVCSEKTFDDSERITEQYYDEIAALVKESTGASKVHVMSHVVRKTCWESAFEAEKDLPDDAPAVGSSGARFVHCDNSLRGARAHIAMAYPEDAEKLDNCRWGAINVWKPFDHPATRDALAFADPASIRDDELREILWVFAPRRDSVQENSDSPTGLKSTEHIQEGKSDADPATQAESYTGGQEVPPGALEGWQCTAPLTPDQHKWYYVSDMTPDEVLLLKICDSRRDVANKLMHTSFSGENDHGPERHSIEVRCVVFWEDQPVN